MAEALKISPPLENTCMRRYTLYLIIFALTLVVGIVATLAFDRAANSLVNALYPEVQLDAVQPRKKRSDCYTYTPRTRVIDKKGRTYCVGGERVRISNCYE